MKSDTHPEAVAKSLLFNAVMSTNNGVAIADARKKDMPLIFVNQAFEKMTGYTAAEVLGENCRFLQGEDKEQPPLKDVRHALKEKKSCSVVLKNYRKDGTLFWNELYISPVQDESGETTHFIGIQNDVTARVEAVEAQKRMEEELRASNRELEQLNEHKNALLGMAAHDIRNPLSAIMMNTELLSLNSGDAQMTNAQQRASGRIREQAERMLDMLNDLLDLSAIESGKLVMQFSTIDLQQLIEEHVSVYRQTAAIKQVTLRHAAPADLPPVQADPRRIGQVLDNLVSNAVKFSEPGTTVTVEAVHQDNTVRVDVIDQGPGIPEDERKLLFKPFSTTSVGPTAGESSTGLGLAICRKIIDGHPQGSIRVHSTPGQGSTFSFFLQVA